MYPSTMSSMTDEQMILTIEKMNAELRTVMDEIAMLRQRFQVLEKPAAAQKKLIKLKKKPLPASAPGEAKPPTGIVTWNAYKKFVRDEMEATTADSKISNEAVMEQAKRKKAEDPEGYIAFCMAWLAENQ